ncbi:MAG: carboxymuconolactone decarboxylase family protein [Pseudomonadota bacterium]|nr:carboxymuconolactone decarboxylase family protein [Pseudomonadota bacterium]
MADTSPDILPETGCRLPAPVREALDDERKEAYDRLANFQDGALFGLRGPTAMGLHSPGVAKHQTALNNYLRFQAEFSPAIRELAILVAAREVDSRFEWAAHEAEALKEGVPEAVIDAVRHRKTTDELAEEYALIIEFGRQALRDRRVSPDMFARLNTAYGPTGVTDLAFLIGNYISLAVFIATIDAQVPDGRTFEFPVL